MSLQAAVVLCSILAIASIGLLAGRGVRTAADYFVSSRKAPTLLIAGTLFASMLSTNGFMGDAAWTYGGALVNAVTLNALCGAGYVLGALFFGRYLRRAEPLTMAEYFGRRFDSPAVRRLAAVVTALSLTAYLLAVTTGTGILISELLEVKVSTGYLLAWLCFTSFTFYGGSFGVVITDTVMFFLFIGATVLAGPFIFEKAGGLGSLMENLLQNPSAPDSLFAYHGNFEALGAKSGDKLGAVMRGVTYGLIWLVAVGVSPWQAGRNLMAKSEHVALRSSAVACVCTTVFLTLLYLMAVSVIAVAPDLKDPTQVIIYAAYNMAPKLLGSLVLAGIMAAGLSSASTFLSIVGLTIANDVLKLDFESDEERLWKTRVVMLAVSAASLALSYMNLGSIRIISWFASTLIASSWAVIAFGSVWSRSLTARGALWSMMAGFSGFLAAKIAHSSGLWPVFEGFLDPFFVGLGLSLLFAFLGSRGEEPGWAEISVLARMRRVPPRERPPEEYQKTVAYANALIVIGLAVTTVLIAFWALPYNELAKAAALAP
ncbi:MAG: sodium:solute symporter family protein [Deltaproteobacteria bacterium]|jgi:sodium/pantothenate symporter|nr:sodium:solute symporter family protein [Deltaproteobacteria bacterium]